MVFNMTFGLAQIRMSSLRICLLKKIPVFGHVKMRKERLPKTI